jgi:hypothetical protein
MCSLVCISYNRIVVSNQVFSVDKLQEDDAAHLYLEAQILLESLMTLLISLFSDLFTPLSNVALVTAQSDLRE